MTQKTLTSQYEVELHCQILKVCHEMELSLHDNILGSKIFTNYQRVALIVLFQRSGKALRNFVSELKESLWPKWLGLKELVSKSTLHRWIKKFDVSFLRKILATTVAKQKPSLMAVDATGFDSWQRSRHYEKRLRQFSVHKKHDPYAKVDLLVDTENKLVHDWVLRVKPRHDILGASTMMKRFKQKDVLVLADKGYDSEHLHQEIAASGNLLYAPVRDFRVKKPKGLHRRRCSKGLEKYHQRNIVESINFSLKSRFRSLRSKIHYMKKREFGWKIITYNMEKLSQSVNALLKLFLRILFWDKAVFSALEGRHINKYCFSRHEHE
jgi:hypothetical protein